MATSRPPVQVCFSTTDFKTTSEERLNAVRSAIDDEIFRADEWCESEFQPSAEPSATASGSAHDIDTESSHKRASPLAAVLLNSAYRSSDNNNAVPCGIPAASSAFQQLPSEGFQIPIGEPQDLRSLDPADLFWQAYHNIGNLMICNCITIVSTHPLVLQHVRAAAEMLLCRHQALRCSINAAPIPGEMRPDLEKNQDATRDQPDSATHEGTNFASRLRSFFVDSAGSLCRSCRRRRKVYVWRDNRSSAYLDVAMAQGGDVDRERGTFETVEGEDWVKAMKFEQSVPFDTSRGPLWRLRLFPSRKVDEEQSSIPSDLFCPAWPARHSSQNQTSPGSRRHGSAAPLSFTQLTYRTRILGIFHHSVMDGLSRQNFWNELSCCLLLLHNIERYSSYMHEVFRAGTRQSHFCLMDDLHHSRKRSSLSSACEHNSEVISFALSRTGGREGAPATASPFTSSARTGVACCAPAIWPRERDARVRYHQDIINCPKIPLPCTRLPDAVSLATPLPIPLEMLKIVLLFPRLLAWGYLWERRLLRRIRNPLPTYYPPELFGTDAMIKRAGGQRKQLASIEHTTTRTPARALESSRPSTAVIPILINKEMTTALLQICKKRRTGLNGLIIGTAAVAMSELMWHRKTVLKEIELMLDGARKMKKEDVLRRGVLAESREAKMHEPLQMVAEERHHVSSCIEGNTVGPGAHSPRVAGKTLEENSAISTVPHREARLKQESKGRERANDTEPRWRWSVWKAGCRQVRYAFERLRALMRRPTCNFDPDQIGDSNIENHAGPVYLYSLQAISGRRWFKHRDRGQFEPTEFEDQMLFQSFLLEQTQLLLARLTPDDTSRLQRSGSANTGLPDSIRGRPAFAKKYEEDLGAEAHFSRLANIDALTLPVGKPRRQGTTSVPPIQFGRGRTASHNANRVTACMALPSPQMCQAVTMAVDTKAEPFALHGGEPPDTGTTAVCQRFRTTLPDIRRQRSLRITSSDAETAIMMEGRKISDETRVPSDSEVTQPRNTPRKEGELWQESATLYSSTLREDDSSLQSRAVALLSGADPHSARHRDDAGGGETDPSVTHDAASARLKSSISTRKKGTDEHIGGDPAFAEMPSTFSVVSCSTGLAPDPRFETGTDVSAGAGSSQLRDNFDQNEGESASLSSELVSEIGKRTSFRHSLAASLMKIRSWIARKSRGGKRDRQQDDRRLQHEKGQQNAGSLRVDSQACQISTAATNAIQVTPRPGLGSYALVMPIRIRVSPKCADLSDDLWELASRSAKDVHGIVNAQRSFRPSYALVPWHSITVYVGSVIDRLPLLQKLGGMKPSFRPSAFLISNGGKWDATSVDTFMHRLLLEVAHASKRHRAMTIYRLLHHQQQMKEAVRALESNKQGVIAPPDNVDRNSACAVAGSSCRPSHQRLLPSRSTSSPGRSAPTTHATKETKHATNATTQITWWRVEEGQSTKPHNSGLGQLPKQAFTPTSGRHSFTGREAAVDTTALLARNVPKFHPFSLKVESSWSVVAQHNVGLNYFAHNVVTVDGCLNWTLQYHTNMVSRELATCYANRIIAILEKLCENERLKDEQVSRTSGLQQQFSTLEPELHAPLCRDETWGTLRRRREGVGDGVVKR